MAKVYWTVDARSDLLAIGAHIGRDSPAFARIFVLRVTRATRHLSRFPMIGRVVPEFEDESLREVIFQNYRVVYRVRRGEIGILAVVHGAVDLAAVAERRPWELG